MRNGDMPTGSASIARTRTRQRVCGKERCQAERRRQSQRRWRAKHPEDAAGRRLRAALARVKQSGEVPLGTRLPLGIPWDELQDEIRAEEIVIVRFLFGLALRLVRDEIASKEQEITHKIGNYWSGRTEDQMGRVRAPP